jgi:hypothetical protein
MPATSTCTTSGFLLNIWEAIEWRGATLILDSSRRAIAVECESAELATELVRVAKDPTIWSNPLQCELVQSENIVHLIW